MELLTLQVFAYLFIYLLTCVSLFTELSYGRFLFVEWSNCWWKWSPNSVVFQADGCALLNKQRSSARLKREPRWIIAIPRWKCQLPDHCYEYAVAKADAAWTQQETVAAGEQKLTKHDAQLLCFPAWDKRGRMRQTLTKILKVWQRPRWIRNNVTSGPVIGVFNPSVSNVRLTWCLFFWAKWDGCVAETKTPPPRRECVLTLFHTLEHLWKALRSALRLSSLQQHNGNIIGIWDGFPSPEGCTEVHVPSAWDHLYTSAPPHIQL